MKTHPSSDEEGWRAERRGGAEMLAPSAKGFFSGLFRPALPASSKRGEKSGLKKAMRALVDKAFGSSMNTTDSSLVTSSALAWAHPIVREWFLGRLGQPTEPQEQGWPHILAGKTTLISAPTGSGKTLAAFLVCIDRLVQRALAGELRDETQVLYISPLKALGNDIQKNLEIPLGEILKLATARGLTLPEIRTAVRTGDTLVHDRRAMLNRPPHILVTTPESLYILLTAEKSRQILKTVETVIVDEIHAVADDKRGAHLVLSLERLEALTHRPPLRIGLSATQRPIELVAHFLTGNGRPDPAVVQIGHQREVDLAIEVPASELGPVASHEMWDEIYDRIAGLARQHRSTLVFVNTRRLAERVAHHLAERLGRDAVATHHGSLSRKLRLDAERRLKAGEIQVLVATASLNSESTSGRWSLFARSDQRVRSRLPGSESGAPATGTAPFPRAASLPPLATN